VSRNAPSRLAAAAARPTGTVTFLFTDIEGSTALLDRLGTERYETALARHRALIALGRSIGPPDIERRTGPSE
jgi:class 3 adenylate cyclase